MTVALDHFQRNGEHHPKWSHVVWARTAAQHQLLSLPDMNDAAAAAATAAADNDDSVDIFDQTERQIYRICQYAALIYSDILLFPMPNTTGVKLQLAEQLRGVFEELEPKKVVKYNSLLLWALFLGWIAASFTKHRVWFVEELHRRLDEVGLVKFEEFKSVMERHLWWDYSLYGPPKKPGEMYFRKIPSEAFVFSLRHRVICAYFPLEPGFCVVLADLNCFLCEDQNHLVLVKKTCLQWLDSFGSEVQA